MSDVLAEVDGLNQEDNLESQYNVESEHDNDMNGIPRQGRERTPDSVKIFIGQVSKSATEAELLPLLQPYGTIQELTIVKDKATNTSRGCAFAVFSNRLEANAAIQALHNAHIMPGMSNPIQVSIANGEQERLENKLFVGMISKTANEQEVTALFSTFGNIEEVHILRDKATNESKGCAFIKYELRSSALSAIEALNGRHQMQGAPQAMVVKFADTKKKETKSIPVSHQGQGHMHLGVQTHHQAHHHQAHHQAHQPPPQVAAMPFAMGPMMQPSMHQPHMRPQFQQQYNQFAQPGWAAAQQWGQHGMATNFAVYGAPAAHTGEDRSKDGNIFSCPPGCNLFIYHLPPSFTDADLAATFQPFGALVSAKVYVDRNTGESKGFGFVSYDNPSSAEAAISHMNGFQIGSKRLKVQHKKVHGAQAGRPY